MERRAIWEYMAVIILLGLLLFGLYPALRYARREHRDGIRRTEVIQLKRALETYYNEHEQYPLQFPAGAHQYVVTESDARQALAWYVRAQLENQPVETAQFDEEYNIYSRVVREGEQTFFDVCGGTSTCGAPAHTE